MPGQVIGLGDLKLGVGNGPEGSSVLTSEKRNLRLESGSRLVLVLSVAVAPKDPGSTASAAAAHPTSPNPPDDSDAFDEAEICVAPACSLALSAGQTETSSRADLAMPVKQLGFSVPADQAIYDFDHSLTIVLEISERTKPVVHLQPAPVSAANYFGHPSAQITRRARCLD